MTSQTLREARKYEETSNSLSELRAHYEEIDKENSHLKEQKQKDILDKQTAINNVINEKNKEINSIKEKITSMLLHRGNFYLHTCNR